MCLLQAREISQAEVDQQKRRALKAQKARQAAIESLRLKREERKQEVKRIAEQEIVMCYNYIAHVELWTEYVSTIFVCLSLSVLWRNLVKTLIFQVCN